ncbi:hypothetical protein CXIVA_05730 [Clostridium sp. SY8519]|nr:hypothetical protein CXIVA_05730 [Clostridium sp. SY8519]
MEEDPCGPHRGKYRSEGRSIKGGRIMWILQDIVTQYVIGIVLCAIITIIWKLTHKGEKL